MLAHELFNAGWHRNAGEPLRNAIAIAVAIFSDTSQIVARRVARCSTR
jgi:hypothetical protein